MLKCIKYFFYIFSVLAMSQNAHAFDLKALTDKIQKDIGSQLNVPNSGGSNPLGGLLKGLNQNNTNNSNNISSSNMPNTKGNTKLAKGICEPNIPQIVRNLPKGDISLIEKDFCKNQNEIKKNTNFNP
jgi:hypothetical protein